MYADSNQCNLAESVTCAASAAFCPTMGDMYLPDALWHACFADLGPNDLARAACCCTAWRDLASRSPVWEEACTRWTHWKSQAHIDMREAGAYRKVYAARFQVAIKGSEK